MSAMDPHYLQRVAIAGSRIGASVKPPVAGPPQMPGSVWSSLRPVSTDLTLPPDAEDYAQLGSRPASASPRAEIVDFDPESERAVVEERRPNAELAPDVQPAPSGETSIAPRSSAGRQEKPQLPPLAPALEPVTRTGHLMRQERPQSPPVVPEGPQEVIRRVLSVGNGASITAPKRLRPIAQPPPATEEGVTQHRTADEGNTRASQAMIPAVVWPCTQLAARAPRGLRPVSDPVPAAADELRAALPLAAEAPRTSAEGPIPAQPETGQRSAIRRGNDARLAGRWSAPAAEAMASDALEPTALSPLPRLALMGMAAFQGRPIAAPAQVSAMTVVEPELVPKSQGPPVLPPNLSPSDRSESRITIGRIEVQVNNRAPQLQPVSTPEPVRVSRPASALLEAYYLDRFSLRP